MEDGEVYVLSNKKVEEEKIKLLMEEFHQEFSLLYGEFKPVHVRGFCVPLKDVKNYETSGEKLPPYLRLPEKAIAYSVAIKVSK